MIPSASLNALRLIDADQPTGSPSGVMLARRDAASMAGRLAKRAHHYPALRVTAFRDRLVLWSMANEVRLPWFDEGAVYLTHMEKMIFFPIDKRLDLPATWIDAIATRLAAVKGISRPLLLWPSSPDQLTAIGLGLNSCRFPAVDWHGIAQS